MANTESEKFRKPARWRRLYVVLFVLSAAWSFRGLVSGHRVADCTFEDALKLAEATDNPKACLVLRDRIVAAVATLKASGEHGNNAVAAIHEASKP